MKLGSRLNPIFTFVAAAWLFGHASTVYTGRTLGILNEEFSSSPSYLLSLFIFSSFLSTSRLHSCVDVYSRVWWKVGMRFVILYFLSLGGTTYHNKTDKCAKHRELDSQRRNGCSGLQSKESKLGKQTDLEKLMVEVRTAAAWHQLRGTCQGEGFQDAWS